MRGKRSKQYRKLMQQYGLNFGFREPYQVLIDAPLVQDAHRFRMALVPALERTLHGKVKPMITQCSIRHLYSLNPNSAEAQAATGGQPSGSLQPAHPGESRELIELAKGYERRRCNHHTLPAPLSTLDCLREVVDAKGNNTNKNRYVVASQDPAVRAFMRRIPGVPIIYIKRSVMVMEPMSDSTERERFREERGKVRSGLKEKNPRKRKREDDGEDVTHNEEEGKRDSGVEGVVGENGEDDAGVPVGATRPEPVPKKRKVKGPKGPNPLSIKKPKKRPEKEQIELPQKGEERPVEHDEEVDSRSLKAPSALSPDGNDAVAVTIVEGEATEGAEGVKGKRKRKRKHKSAASQANEEPALGADAAVIDGSASL